MNRAGFFLLSVTLLLGGCNERDAGAPAPFSLKAYQPDRFLEFLNDQRGEVMTDDWSRAYYRAVDPNGLRTTLEDWKAINGFADCDEQVHVIFRDAKDLGYGRNMRACKHDDGRFAVFVDNYVVRIRPGDPSNYGPINVEAALIEDRNHAIGSNAIEYTPIDPTDPDSDKVAKFFTFAPDGQQNLRADLDGRGDKPMPQPCLLCHGATLLPLDLATIEQSATPWAERGVETMLKTTQLNSLELESFDYSSVAGYSRDQQEEPLRRLNRFIQETMIDTRARAEADQARWWPEFAIELAEARYAGQSQQTGQTYQDDSVPCGWRLDPAADADCAASPDLPAAMRPEGVDVLYKRVVEPHCIACHSLRGNSAGQRQASNDANAITFSNYERFIGYSDLITDYVYHRGVMPLSLRNFEKFWADACNGPAAILATFLPDFDRYDSAQCVIEPGLPVALPGADRRLTTPAVLNAAASLFAVNWFWEILDTPPGAQAGFSDATAVAPQFNADLDGEYRLRLTVSNGLGSSSEELLLTVDNSMSPRPDELNFVDHVLPVLRDPVFPGRGQACIGCHTVADQQAGLYAGIPVVYDDLNPRVYRDVLERVDLIDPENSQFLRKPTRLQHGGGVLINRASADGEVLYQTLINWIRNGAPCGDDPQICG